MIREGRKSGPRVASGAPHGYWSEMMAIKHPLGGLYCTSSISMCFDAGCISPRNSPGRVPSHVLVIAQGFFPPLIHSCIVLLSRVISN